MTKAVFRVWVDSGRAERVALFRATWIAFCAIWIASIAKADALSDELRIQVGAFDTTGPVTLADVPISNGAFITEFYQERDFKPAWSDPELQNDLFDQIERAEARGFAPEDFNAAELLNMQINAATGDVAAQASFDILATESASLLLHHTYFGKVDPETLGTEWNFNRPLAQGNPAKLVNQYLDVATLGALIEEIDIYQPVYLGLQQALAQYRSIADAGGWPTVPDNDVLKPGDQNQAVLVLRDRLKITRDLPADAPQSDIYDSNLEQAVAGFQTRHGLEADGVIGPKTYQALNRSVEFRIDQLRLTLERARWLLREIEGDFVFVNIANAETVVVQNNEIVWRTRSIVGQVYRKTPLFRDEIEYIEINPTWTVPATIFRKDKLEKIRSDIGYLNRGNYDVVNADRQPLDPRSVNWFADDPGVTLVQRPGPDNALGLVKFMFPNKYSVYLHDTDNHALFDRAERDLSSGCIRVEHPFELADLLMQDDPSWSPETRDAILASGQTTRINLPEPMPVLLTYYTAWAGPDGQVQFREDIYERDQAVLDALNRPFSW